MSFKRGLLAWSAAVLVVCGAPLSAQNYPNKPLRIFTSGVGGSSDIVVRLLTPGLTALLGQPIVVENRAAILAGETVAKAAPDGYTLLLVGDLLWIEPLMRKTPYDPINDFAPITFATNAPNVLAAHPSLPVKSVKELIALAKAKPGQLNYAGASTGSSNHLAGELFMSMAQIKIVRVPYNGPAPSLNAILGGEVPFGFSTIGSVLPHARSGRLRALAVTSAQPSALLPGVPTVASAGLKGYESGNGNGVFAPAKTPDAVIKRLNQDFVQVLTRREEKERLFNAGFEAAGGSPEEFAATIKAQMAKMGKVIKDSGIKIE